MLLYFILFIATLMLSWETNVYNVLNENKSIYLSVFSDLSHLAVHFKAAHNILMTSCSDK